MKAINGHLAQAVGAKLGETFDPAQYPSGKTKMGVIKGVQDEMARTSGILDPTTLADKGLLSPDHYKAALQKFQQEAQGLEASDIPQAAFVQTASAKGAVEAVGSEVLAELSEQKFFGNVNPKLSRLKFTKAEEPGAFKMEAYRDNEWQNASESYHAQEIKLLTPEGELIPDAKATIQKHAERAAGLMFLEEFAGPRQQTENPNHPVTFHGLRVTDDHTLEVPYNFASSSGMMLEITTNAPVDSLLRTASGLKQLAELIGTELNANEGEHMQSYLKSFMSGGEMLE